MFNHGDITTSWFNEVAFRETLLPSSARWWEKCLSKRSLIKHISSWRINLLYYKHWTDKREYFYVQENIKKTFISNLISVCTLWFIFRQLLLANWEDAFKNLFAFFRSVFFLKHICKKCKKYIHDVSFYDSYFKFCVCKGNSE